MKYLLPLMIIVMISCASSYPQYVPDEMLESGKYSKRWNKHSSSILGMYEEYPIYGYKGVRAYRIDPVFGGAIQRIEKYEDGSCVVVSKSGAGGEYSHSEPDEMVLGPILSIKVDIKRDCDKFIPFDKLDALFYRDEQFVRDNGKDYKGKGVLYSDYAAVERVLEDGTFYYIYTRNEKDLKMINDAIRAVWKSLMNEEFIKIFNLRDPKGK